MRDVQNRRTATANNPPPAGSLLPGQFAVEMGVPTRLWVGVDVALDATQQKLLIDTSIKGGVTTGDVAPANPNPGDLWWDSVGGNLFVRYQDPNSTQWVIANTGGGGGSSMAEPVGAGTWGRVQAGDWQRSVATAGDTMTGPLTISGPASGLLVGLILDGPVNTGREMSFRTAGQDRWLFHHDAGDDFALLRFLGSASYDSVMYAEYATGAVQFGTTLNPGSVNVKGPLTVAGNATAPLQVVPLQQLNAAIAAGPYVLKVGDVMTGALRAPDINAFSATNVWGAGGNLRFGAWDQYTYLLNTDVSGIGYLGRLDAGVWAGVMNFVPGATTVYGTLRTTGRIYAGNASGVAMDQSDEAVHYRDGTGNVIMQYNSGGWYDHWASATGARAWNGPGVGLMSLDGGGNLWIAGTATVSWNLSVAQAGTFGAGVTALDGQFNRNLNVASFFSVASAGYWASNYLQVNVGAAFTQPTSFSANVTYYDNSFFVTQDATNRYFSFATPYAWHYQRATGLLQWANPLGGHFVIDQANGYRIYNARGPMCGVGPYQDWSDRRAKENIVPATEGLAEILQLVPMKFNRIKLPEIVRDPEWPEDTPIPPPLDYPTEIGFVAQDVAPVIPEAVTVAGFALPDGSGTHDDQNPTLSITSATVGAVAVNAIKELHALLLDLTARVTNLEIPPAREA